MAANQPTGNQMGAQAAARGLSSVVSSMQTMASMGGQPAAAVSAAAGQLSKLVGKAGPWGVAIGTMVEAVGRLPQVFKSAADSISNYVAAFSPASADRYSQAWKDLTASIGQILLPVLDLATDGVRWFADTIAGLQPYLQPVVNELTKFGQTVGSSFGDAFREVLSSIAMMLPAVAPLASLMFQIATGPMRLMVDLLKKFALGLQTINQFLADFFGITVARFEGESRGKAAASTGTTDVSSMLRQLRERAFMLGEGGGGGVNYPAQTADYAAKIFGKLNELTSWATGVLMKLVTDGIAFLSNLPKDVAEKLKPVLMSVLNVAVNAIAKLLPDRQSTQLRAVAPALLVGVFG